jgi:hypothetical protein
LLVVIAQAIADIVTQIVVIVVFFVVRTRWTHETGVVKRVRGLLCLCKGNRVEPF